jgi:hypothetical protein
MNIELHIERLVLEGIPIAPREGTLLHAAIHAELERLLRAEGFPGRRPDPRAVARLQGPAIRLPNAVRVDMLGGLIASAIRDGIGS